MKKRECGRGQWEVYIVEKCTRYVLVRLGMSRHDSAGFWMYRSIAYWLGSAHLGTSCCDLPRNVLDTLPDLVFARFWEFAAIRRR